MKIDLLPEEHLHQLQQYLESITQGTKEKKKIKTLPLNGQFDNLSVRKLAYE